MASRVHLHDVGSAQWIVTERLDALHKEEEHFEDFAITIRNEFDWLNEHMAEIFNTDAKVYVGLIQSTPPSQMTMLKLNH